MMVDPDGNMPWWGKVLIGVGIVVVLAIATIATGGTAAGLAGAIFAGALKGAIVSGLTGALIGGGIGFLTGGVDGILNGMANGFLTGVISGAILGGIGGGLKYSPLKASSNAAYKFANSAKGLNSHTIDRHVSRIMFSGKSKFIGSADDVAALIKNGLKADDVLFMVNNSAGKFKYVLDAGQVVGTKGQTMIRVIIKYGGKLVTAFPV